MYWTEAVLSVTKKRWSYMTGIVFNFLYRARSTESMRNGYPRDISCVYCSKS